MGRTRAWRVFGALSTLAAWALHGEARADEPHPTVVLVYAVEPRAIGCPDAGQLKNAVSARLGYDPFREVASRTVDVRIFRDRRDSRGLRAHVGLLGEGGRAGGSRDLVSRSGDCGELASSLTLAISIAIDPMALSAIPEVRPAPPPARCPPPPACPPPPSVSLPVCPPPPQCPPPPASPPPAREPTPIGFRAAAGGLLSLGVAASTVSLGAWARAGLRVGGFSLDVEGRVDPPSQELLSAPRGLETTLLLASLVPCYHFRWLATCGIAGAGVLRGTGVGVAVPARDQSAFVVAGARVGVELPLYGALHLDIHADLLAHVTPVAFVLDGQVVYTTPAVSGAFGLGLLGAFP